MMTVSAFTLTRPNMTDFFLQRDALIYDMLKASEIAKKAEKDAAAVVPKSVVKKAVVSSPASAPLFWMDDHKDSLFWCFYIFRFGMNKYVMATISKGEAMTTEATIKTECAQDLRANAEMRTRVKTLKLLSLKEINSALTPCDKITMHTFFVLCAMYDIFPGVIQQVGEGRRDTLCLPPLVEDKPNPPIAHYLYISSSGRIRLVDAGESMTQMDMTCIEKVKKSRK